MKEIILLFTMLFCHIIGDFNLQKEWIASAKCRSWWEKNNPDPLYKNDYIAVLYLHAFSWTFMIHLPIIVLIIINEIYVPVVVFSFIFAINWSVHIMTDDVKANRYKFKINLVQDQLIHLSQILITWIIYIINM